MSADEASWGSNPTLTMRGDQQYLLFLRADADFADLAPLLAHGDLSRILSCTDCVAMMMPNPAKVHARAHVLASELLASVGACASRAVTFLAYVRALGECNTPAVTLCQTYKATRVPEVSHKEMLNLYALLAPMCTAVPWSRGSWGKSPAVTRDYLLLKPDDWLHGIEWMIVKGARIPAAPSNASNTKKAGVDPTTARPIPTPSDVPSSSGGVFGLRDGGETFEYDRAALDAEIAQIREGNSGSKTRVPESTITCMRTLYHECAKATHQAAMQAAHQDPENTAYAWHLMRRRIEAALAAFYKRYEVKEE